MSIPHDTNSVCSQADSPYAGPRWSDGTFKSSGNAFDWRMGRAPAVSKEEAALEKKRAYEREYNKRRYQLMKAATRVNPLGCI